MIVAKVEIWPGGDSATAKEISRIAIANVSNLKAVSNYIAVVKEDDGSESHRFIEGHRRADGIEALLRLTLEAEPIEEQPRALQDRYGRELREISKSMG